MNATDTVPSQDPLAAYNYCVAWIDLLGQRAAMRDQGLLPSFQSEEEKQRLNAILRDSIGAIIKLQKQAEDMLHVILQPNPDSPLRAALPREQHATWDAMQLTRRRGGRMAWFHMSAWETKMLNAK